MQCQRSAQGMPRGRDVVFRVYFASTIVMRQSAIEAAVRIAEQDANVCTDVFPIPNIRAAESQYELLTLNVLDCCDTRIGKRWYQFELRIHCQPMSGGILPVEIQIVRDLESRLCIITEA